VRAAAHGGGRLVRRGGRLGSVRFGFFLSESLSEPQIDQTWDPLD
jgi:hypothetical protein